jgi:hypothetical protein
VPTQDEINGDFSMSGVDIYDPATTKPNPNYNPNLPVSASNPQFTRQQFQCNGVMNVICPDRISRAAEIMLTKYVPRPNIMMGMGGM